MEEDIHRREHARIIGRGGQDNLPVAESILDGFRLVIAGKIGHGHLRAAFCAEDIGHFQRCGGRSPVNGGIGHENASADIKVVATGFTGPVPIFFREITTFGQGPELAKGIGAEEDAVSIQPGDHHLRPMHHGSPIESQAAAAQGKGIPFFHRQAAAGQVQAVEELPHHLQGPGRSHHLQGGILTGHPRNQASVVRLQMMHHQVIRRASVQGFHEILLPRLCASGIDGIHNGHFLVLNQIRIIGHSLRYFILAFEQVQIQIVRPDISHRFVDFLDHVGYGFSIQI